MSFAHPPFKQLNNNQTNNQLLNTIKLNLGVINTITVRFSGSAITVIIALILSSLEFDV